MKNRLKNYINAGYGALSMTTAEYFRCMKDIRAVTNNLTGNIGSWDARGKVTNMLTGKTMAEELFDPSLLFEWVLTEIKGQEKDAEEHPHIWVVHDLQMFMQNPDPAMVASFRDAVREGSMANHHFILVGATSKLCPEIEKMVTSIEYSLPTKEEIGEIVKAITETAGSTYALSGDDLDRVVNAAAGMTVAEIEDALSLSVVTEKKICWRLIMKEKAKAVEKSGCLKYFDGKISRDSVGGLEELIKYIDLRKDSFTEEAREYGLPAPKGILLVGPAGTGKSLTAKVTSDILSRPLITIDIGAVFGSLVGQSEGNMRLALKTIEAVSPCVLMVDEIEKGLSGSKSSGSTDGGTGSRVMGTLLTWMNDKQSEVYIVATSNDVTQLPPELLRKGRFDEIFFVDLPSDEEREIIFNIHLQKRNRKPKKFDIKKLVDATEGYTGAEIEQVIIDAMFVSFGEKSEITTEHILSVIEQTSPLSTINSSQIERLRSWSKNRCRSASSTTKKAASQSSEKTEAKRKITT
jgi:ATP-dependent 26S proteasome regulatory subunit